MRDFWHTVTNPKNQQLQQRPTPYLLSKPELTDACSNLNLKLSIIHVNTITTRRPVIDAVLPFQYEVDGLHMDSHY